MPTRLAYCFLKWLAVLHSQLPIVQPVALVGDFAAGAPAKIAAGVQLDEL